MARLQRLALLLLRLGTGFLLILWGALRLISPKAGSGLAFKYYSGLLGNEGLQIAFGIAEIVIGTLVVLGLFRRIAYPAQALILVPGALLLWRYLIDPFGVWLLSHEDSEILFFPSITVAAATLALIVLRDFDHMSLDAYLHGRSTQRES